MAKIACLLPREEMAEQARQTLEASGLKWAPHELTIDHISPSERAIEWGRQKQREGVDVIIARGLQATYIKQHTTIPVVEVRLTGQEVGLLIAHAKAILNIKRPQIGLVGYFNNYCNTDHFGEIFDIDLNRYYVMSEEGGPEELRACAAQAVLDQVDIIIGGDTAQSAATAAGIPSLFSTSTGDSFLVAYRNARSLAYAIDLEKDNTAQLKTLLDNTFGVIVRIDAEGTITLINHIAETLLGWDAKSVVGQPLHEVAAGIQPDMLSTVLSGGNDVFSQYVSIANVSLVANIAPIRTGETIIGALMTAQKVELLEEMGTVARRHQYKQERIADTVFAHIDAPSKSVRKAVASAQMYAKSDAPVLFLSEPGNDQERFAQAMHNASKRRAGPFVSINCAESNGETQLSQLFGAGGATGLVSTAHTGTAYLENVQFLCHTCQHRLLGLIKDGILLGGDLQPQRASIRVMATCDETLHALVRDGLFSSELYYMLSTLPLPLEPLRRRPDDILFAADMNLKRYRAQYKRYISLTAGALKRMTGYSWQGNLVQLQAFCHRVVLTSPRRTVDENEIEALYRQMYPASLLATGAMLAEKPARQDDEGALIARLLEKHQGNRSRVASDLGISTTTLWRKMKKYDIHNSFEAQDLTQSAPPRDR